MNLLTIYETLIERGKQRVKQKNDGLHKHRIIPGHSKGTYSKDNVTFLTRKEHRLIHLIRWKLYHHPGDNAAYFRLGGKNCKSWNRGLIGCQEAWNKGKTTPQKGKTWEEIYGYEEAENRKTILRKRFQENNPMCSPEAVAKANTSRKNKYAIHGHPLKNVPKEDEHKKKISKSLSGKKRKVSNKDRERMKGNQITKGMVWCNDGSKNRLFHPDKIDANFIRGRLPCNKRGQHLV